MIKFLQHSSSKYPPRTFENASADATIAFAFDFNTPGERLTREAANSQGKIYIPVNPKTINNSKIGYDQRTLSKKLTWTLNIAGNGAYTTVKYGYDQAKCDQLVFEYLHKLLNCTDFNINVTLIRSGGQSGFDESGLKAAELLHIPALCLCPQGWKFMNQDGETICDEQQFKNRFTSDIIL